MHLKITCPKCAFTFKVDSKYAGKTCRCPSASCDANIAIPRLEKIDANRPSAPAVATASQSLVSQSKQNVVAQRVVEKPLPVKKTPPVVATNRSDSRRPNTTKAADPRRKTRPAQKAKSRRTQSVQKKSAEKKTGRNQTARSAPPPMTNRELRRHQKSRAKVAPRGPSIVPVISVATIVLTLGIGGMWWYQNQSPVQAMPVINATPVAGVATAALTPAVKKVDPSV